MHSGLICWGVFLLLPQGNPAVDQKRIDEAIAKGIQFLKQANPPAIDDRPDTSSDELILWTWIHAGVPAADTQFQSLWKRVVSRPLEKTYNVALLAMILEEVDRVRYQKRIFHCAQFLLDNQCKNGQWYYGTPTPGVPVELNPKDVELVVPDAPPPLSKGKRLKPKVLKKIAVQKTRDGPDKGCSSNAQYAALGLRACADAGILIPKDAIALARKSWIETQHGEKDRPGTGWCYACLGFGCSGSASHAPYCAMTAGGVGSLIIYDYMLGIDWAKDPAIKAGIVWLDKNFSFKENWGSRIECPPSRKESSFHLYYSFYALERAGRLARMEKIGNRVWYPEGASSLLETQKENGSWGPCDNSNPVLDTCFAILFLRRATRPMDDVASVDRFIGPDK